MARMLACDGRFTDAWVVDRTLFEHINQGSCSCCGTVHAMMDIAASMSRLVTLCTMDDLFSGLTLTTSMALFVFNFLRAAAAVTLRQTMARRSATVTGL
jgi:hypothetical protein